MALQRDLMDEERGGIPVRDYRQGGRPASLQGLAKVNFDSIGRWLGYFSLGLGLMQVLAPQRVQKMVGVKGDYSSMIRMFGLREVAHALLIFMQARPHQGVWSRVVGDAMDLAVLGAAIGLPKTEKDKAAVATAAVAGVTALDLLTATQLARTRSEEKQVSTLTREELNHATGGGAFHVKKSITINRSPEELYTFWRNFENLPRFMYHLESVRVLSERRSMWVAKAPAGSHVEWEAEITEDVPNQFIAWQSLPDSDVANSGSVTFKPAPLGRGTEVHVEIDYKPPAGPIGKLVAVLFGEEPTQQVAGDLRRFKQVMEIGEVVRSDGVPEGIGQKTQFPARPKGSEG